MNPLKRLYLWLNRNMIVAAILLLLLAIPTIFLPSLGGPIFALIILVDILFGVGDNLLGWWDASMNIRNETQD